MNTPVPPLVTGRDLAASPRWPVDPARPLHLDLGTGLGHFLVDLAARHPEHDFVAVERDPGVARRAARRVARAGLVNARVVRLDGRNFLAESLPAGVLTHLWINFPDPWPKARHAERRHTWPWMLDLLLSRLRPGGMVHLATDALDYAQTFAEALAGRPGVRAGAAPEWRRDALGIETKYERKWRAAGRPMIRRDWTVDHPPTGPELPPTLPPVRLQFASGRPEVGLHDRGRWLAKVFPPSADGELRLILIDRETGLETFAKVPPTTRQVELHGPWTAWKRDLLIDLGALAVE